MHVCHHICIYASMSRTYMQICRYNSMHICMYVVIYANMQASVGVHMETQMGNALGLLSVGYKPSVSKSRGRSEGGWKEGKVAWGRTHSEPI